MPRGLNDVRQQAFIASYEKLLNTMAADEAVVFVDAVHPTHQVRAAGCWAPKDTAIAVEQTTGRQSLNIHGAINLETGQTQMLEVTKVNAMSLIALLKAIEAAHPAKKQIHVYLDNASYHHATIVRDWLKEQHRKSVLHFIPPYCPHLDPIEQCWALARGRRRRRLLDQTLTSAVVAFHNRSIREQMRRSRDTRAAPDSGERRIF